MVATSFKAISTSVCDAGGRLTPAIDPLSHVTISVYDMANRKTQVIDALGQISTRVYDAASRMIAAIDPLWQVTTTAYDDADRASATCVGWPVMAVTDAELNVTTTVYDAAGRVTESTNGDANTTTTVYDPGNRPTETIDANSHTTTFLYDAANRRTQEINADNGIYTTMYDPAGNVTLSLDPRNEGVTNDYDLSNRLTLQTYTDGAISTYTFDPVGNRLTQDSSAGVFTSAYDPRNMVTSLEEPGGKTLRYSYDAARRTTEMDAYGKGTFTYEWDAAGRQTLGTSPTLGITTMAYDPLNRVIERQFANEASTTQTYDPAGNLSGITNNGPLDLVSQLEYAYNNANQRTMQTESDGTITSWIYDGAYQLVQENRAGGPAGTSFSIDHSYDAVGNQTVQADGTTTTTYTYSAANRLEQANANGVITTYTNDAAGNRTQLQSPSENTFYTWNAQGLMTAAELAAGVVEMTYNADGQRVSKQGTDGSTTGYLYDGKKLLQETDGEGGDITTTYSSTGDDEYGDLQGEDGITHQYDAQASTNALLDSLGNVQAQIKYYAFGQVSAVSIEGESWTALSVDQWSDLSVDGWATLPVEIATSAGWVGQKQYYQDFDIHLYLLGSGSNPGTYYDPFIGRSISEDPIRQARGDNNLFPYVGNNPINRIDPSGHDDQGKREVSIVQAKEKEWEDQQQARTLPAPSPTVPAATAPSATVPVPPSVESISQRPQAIDPFNIIAFHGGYHAPAPSDYYSLLSGSFAEIVARPPSFAIGNPTGANTWVPLGSKTTTYNASLLLGFSSKLSKSDVYSSSAEATFFGLPWGNYVTRFDEGRNPFVVGMSASGGPGSLGQTVLNEGLSNYLPASTNLWGASHAKNGRPLYYIDVNEYPGKIHGYDEILKSLRADRERGLYDVERVVAWKENQGYFKGKGGEPLLRRLFRQTGENEVLLEGPVPPSAIWTTSAAWGLRTLKVGGGVYSAIITADSIYSGYLDTHATGNSKYIIDAVVTEGGSWGGAWGGAAIGASYGSVVGPAGTIVGGLIGGFLGSSAGRYLGKHSREWFEQGSAWTHENMSPQAGSLASFTPQIQADMHLWSNQDLHAMAKSGDLSLYRNLVIAAYGDGTREVDEFDRFEAAIRNLRPGQIPPSPPWFLADIVKFHSQR